ncbi:NAD(P)-dependent alcohol dehydrogenase [Mycetocola tolaasinivorans]|uniref:NAD(P)-dependent alcohol dehydrogenase n=2 Tax=Mycetocola tolaasinivorans TaxID=76635 RepID=A0A3L7A749_9MICO|nr:NAD(P)-dependent alcohol dehydrogenase [Mycetocola tolaasinivorans]
MRASVLHAARQVALEERALPHLDADQVLVKISAVGICGSDVHYFHEGRIGDFIVEAPMILGHESAGVIAAVGADVDPARIGSRVSIEPQRPRANSRETLEGNYNLDPHMEFYATPPIDGAFAEYAVIQSHFAHDVPDSVSDEAAALIEPLSVGIATARKAEFTAGSRVLIAGAGPIGVIIAQVARAYGALEVIVSDLSASRREQALRFGATRVLDPREEDVSTLGVDAFIDASGAAAAVTSGIRAVRPAGRVVLVGLGSPEMTLPVSVIQNNELIVTGIFRYTNTWPLAIDLVAAGKIDLDGLVTGQYGLAEVETALEASTQESALKTVIYPAR